MALKAEGTRRIYRGNFKRFLGRWGLEAEGLFEMKMEDLRSPDPRDRKRVERMVKVQMAEMSERGMAASTCRNLYKAVRSFFESQGLDFSLKSRDQPRGDYNGARLVLPDKIREMLDVTSWEFKKRNRAILLLIKDSGLRVGDVSSLDVGEYLGAQTEYNERGEPFKAFKPRRIQKTRSLGYIHIGPESIEALKKYLEERAEEAPLREEDPLFLDRRGKRLSGKSITEMVLGVAKKLENSYKISANSLRDFHQTMLEAGMPKNWVAKLQGKKITDSSSPYSQPEALPGGLIQAYMKAYERLRVLGTAEERKKDEEIQALRKRVAELEERGRKRMRLEDLLREPEAEEILVRALKKILKENP